MITHSDLFNFSPLEQFDSVSFYLGSQVLELANLYSFYLFETEYNVVQCTINEYNSSLGLPMFRDSYIIYLVIFGFIYFIVQLNILSQILILQDFSHLFLGIFFSLFFPAVFEFIFINNFVSEQSLLTDLFYTPWYLNNLSLTEVNISNSIVNFSNNLENDSIMWEGLTQIHFSFFFDENLISFVLAFFLLGGSEQEDDEDFLFETEEADFVDDIVASLFIANLGKEIEGNGELLIKVSSIFSFVLMNNLMGMLPYSDTGTSSLILTFWVALSIFVSLLTLMIRKHGVAYFFSLFMPAGCPLPLLFLLIPIEFISYSFRLVSLSVRLFANMMAGHTLLKVIVGFSFTMILLGDSMVLVNLFPVALLFILTFLEVGVAVVQAYIFAILSCIYLKDIFVSH